MEQDIAQIIVKSVNAWVLAIFALIGVLSPFVGLGTSAAISAGWLSEDSGWARFAAKFFSFTLQAKSNSLPDPNGKDLKKVLNGLITLGVIAVLFGCKGTFEEAKLAGINQRKLTPPSSVPTPSRCESLSERQYWFTGSGLGLVALGAAAVSVALPVKTQTVETILVASGTGATVTGGGLVWFGNAAGINYTQEGCGK
jgi:hypothetical protein